MQIEDTMVVTTGGELTIPAEATPQQYSEALGEIVRVAAQQAATMVLKNKAFYRSHALSAVPLLYEYAGKRMVLVTTIVALMPDPLKMMNKPGTFPYRAPGSTN